jgi:hypothetical protein
VRAEVASATCRRNLSRSLIAASSSSSSAEPVSITCLPVTGSCPPKSRIWYRPPRCRMPVRSFGACFVRAMKGSLSSGIGQSVGQRSSEEHQARPSMLVRGGGQGRGRTADLPIFSLGGWAIYCSAQFNSAAQLEECVAVSQADSVRLLHQ